jgi:pyruvyl transferase EpsO
MIKDTFGREMERLKAEHDTLATLIPPGNPVAYLDYPTHSNIGDLLIMLGTDAFLARLRTPVIYRGSLYNFPDRPPPGITPDTVILCHGGGNFGDLYPVYQAFRERIVRQFPDNRVVFLPQTLYYRDPEKLKACTRVLDDHPDLHIFVRDTNSAMLARQSFSAPVYLAPDMAHHLWPALYLRTKGQSPSGTLIMIREDIERGAVPDQLRSRASEFFDWADMLTLADRAMFRVSNAAHRTDRKVLNVQPAWLIHSLFTKYLCGRAADLFARFDTVVTSRLHGHILACLVGRRSVVLDNSYGKNSSYFRTWTHGLRTAEIVVDETSLRLDDRD